MIRVTVELVPGGFSVFRRTIGTMEISNISDLAPLSDYHVSIDEAANPIASTPARSIRCFVRNHDRSSGIWKLIALTIREMEESLTSD